MFGEYDDISTSKRLCEIRRQITKTINFKLNYYKGANHVFIMSSKIDKTKYYYDMINFIAN